ncbi:MAG: glycosyltransferase family A protein [Blautia sp.]
MDSILKQDYKDFELILADDGKYRTVRAPSVMNMRHQTPGFW